MLRRPKRSKNEVIVPKEGGGGGEGKGGGGGGEGEEGEGGGGEEKDTVELSRLGRLQQ